MHNHAGWRCEKAFNTLYHIQYFSPEVGRQTIIYGVLLVLSQWNSN